MKIQILSDLHLEGGINPLLKDFKPAGDVLVLAGDITTAKNKGLVEKVFGHLDIPVIYILGNHEYYWGNWELVVYDYKDWFDDRPNFHVLDGHYVLIDDVMISGATYWNQVSPLDELDVRRFVTDFSMIENVSIQKMREANFMAKDRLKFQAEIARRPDCNFKHVVVTHFAPSYQAQEARFKGSGLSSYFYNNDDEFVELINPDLWIYGHTHGNLRFNCGEVPVHCNQMGYTRGNMNSLRAEPCYADFKLDYVVEV